MSNITEGREYIGEWVEVMNKGAQGNNRYWLTRHLCIDVELFKEGERGSVRFFGGRKLNRLSYDPLRDELTLHTSFQDFDVREMIRAGGMHNMSNASLATRITVPKFTKLAKPQMLVGHGWEEEYSFKGVRCWTDSGLFEKYAGEGVHFFVNIRIYH